MAKGSVTVLVGLQRGDEGKGRFTDALAPDFDIVARYNGGPNAGHTIHVDGKTIALHQVPAGILYKDVKNVIGNGMYIDPVKLLSEIEQLRKDGIEVTPENLAISYGAHLIMPHHILLDEKREEGGEAQGSTKTGIAYVAAEKYERIGARAELIELDTELLEKLARKGLEKVGSDQPAAEAKDWVRSIAPLKDYITDTAKLLNDNLSNGKTVLAEGAQAFWLDIEGGMYPYVTSSHPSVGGAINGLRVGPAYIDRVIGVVKSLPSHVGGGPFVSQIVDESTAELVRGQKGDIDAEFGATTGRPRRVGWLDLPALRTAIRDNGVTEIALTKFDTLERLEGKVSVATSYHYGGQDLAYAPSSARMLEECQPIYKELDLWEGSVSQARQWNDLPEGAKQFIDFLEKELGVPIKMIGVGPGRDQVISR